MRRRSGACALVVALVLTAAAARAQPATPDSSAAPPTIAAVRLAAGEMMAIDGVLDEGAWARAVPAKDFKQRDPRPGEPATERTEVRVVVDSTRIILGVTCFDSEPDRMLANQMQRDQSFGGDDRFLWGFDTYLDGRTGYFFEINPAGAMGDGLVTGPGGGGGGGGCGGGRGCEETGGGGGGADGWSAG